MKNCNNRFAVKAMYVFVAFTLFMLGIGVKGVEGQTANTYSFATGTGQALLNPTFGSSIVTIGCDDCASSVQNIGFTFVYEGNNYTQFSVNSNGLMRLGGTAVSTAYSNDLDANANNPKIMPLWDDLNSSTDGGVRFGISGSAPNRILVVDYRVRNGSGGGVFNCRFQVWLYETTNVIRFVYETGTTPGSFSCGLGGSTSTNYQSVTTSSQTCSNSTTNDANSTWPGSGRFYAFTPPALCSGTPNAGTATGTTTGCASTSFTMTTSGLTTGLGISYLWETSPDGSSGWTSTGVTTANLTTSTATTAYYRLRTTCSYSGLTNYTNVVSYTVVRCSSVNVPSTGSNNVACGTNTMIYDNGGSGGAYADNSNGYTVLENAETGVITLTGTYSGIETCCDYFRIYQGVGTGGTLLYTYGPSGTGTITPFSSPAGIPITIQFYSDGSVTGAGFALQAIYSGACVVPCVGQITDNTIYANGNDNEITVTTGETFTISSSGGNTNNYCYWASNDGGATWSIFAQTYCNQASFNYSLSTVGQYIFHVRNYDACDYCWDAAHGSNCTCGAGGSDCIVTVNVVPLPGENCSNAQNLATLTSPYAATTVGYADDISTCRTGYSDRIFYIEVPYLYTLNIGEASNNYDEYEYIGYGPTCGSTTQIQCWDNDGLAQTSWLNNTGSSQTVWYIQDAFSGSGTFNLQWNLVAPPPYVASYISMNTGAADWCEGETRTVSVTIQNIGSQAWADGGGEDFNIGVKWNGDPDYLVRVDAQNLASGASQTFNLTVTAPAAGTNNLTFNVVREGISWFGGPYTSAAQNIKAIPTAVSAGGDVAICNGSNTQLIGSASASGSTTFNFTASGYDGGVAYSLGDYVEGITSGLPADAIITSISYSTSILSGGTDYCGSWWGADIYVNGSIHSAACNVSNQTYSGLNGQLANNQTFRLWVYDIDDYDDAVDMGLSVTVNYTFTPSYTWSPSTGLNNPNIYNPIASPSSSTTYTMTANANGCSVSDDVTVNVVNIPSVGTMSITETEICEGTTVTISNTASNGTIYYWASSEGGYPCNWDIINQGYGGSNSFDYSFSANPNTSICEANPYRIHVYSASYNATCGWSWDYGSGSSQYINVYPAPSWNTITPNTSGVYCELDGVFLSATVNNPDPSSSVTWQRLPYSLATWTTGIANNAIDYPTPNIYEYQPVYTTTITGCDLSSPVTVSIDMFNSGDWTGNTSSNWHDTSNWCGNTVPNSSSSVVIPGGTLNYPEISNGDASICDISIGGGAQLTISNNRSLNVYCSFTNNGTFISGNNNESIVIKGNPTDLTTGNDDFNFLTIDAGAFMDLHDDLDIKRNFVNNGTFAQTGNTIRFMGSVPQYVTCGASQFEDITIDNSSAGTSNIILNDDFNIIDHLVLDNGVIDPNGNSMNFGAASNVTVNSTASFVNGKMQYTGSSQFTFPAGHVNSHDLDGNSVSENYTIYSPITITPSSNATVEVEYIFDNSSMPDWWEHGGNMDATLHHVTDREYWYVNSDQNLSDVTLYWYDNGHAVGAICPHGFDFGDQSDFVASDLTVAYWSGSVWRDAGGVVSGDHDNGSVTASLTIPFGSKAPKYITFGSKNNLNPLPVELTYFTGNCKNGTTEFNWQTASETNNSHFLVQVSNNMKDFETIGKIDGAGNTSSVTNYAFSTNTITETSYYRLMQIDFDGKSKIYPPISVSCNDNTFEPTLSVHPNPFESEIYVILEHLNSEIARVEIINTIGQIVSENEIDIDNGFAKKHYDLSNLKPGMYQLRVISGETVLSSKIIKK